LSWGRRDKIEPRRKESCAQFFTESSTRATKDGRWENRKGNDIMPTRSKNPEESSKRTLLLPGNLSGKTKQSLSKE